MTTQYTWFCIVLFTKTDMNGNEYFIMIFAFIQGH